jgi:hypothetical protein
MNSYTASEFIDPEVFIVTKDSRNGSVTKDTTRSYQGPHHALRGGILARISELKLPADFPNLKWVTTGPHKLSTSTAILRHIGEPNDPQAMLEQLKLSKTDPTRWP